MSDQFQPLYDDWEDSIPGERHWTEITDKEWPAIERLQAEFDRIAAITDNDENKAEAERLFVILYGED